MNKKKILIVEDDEIVAQLVKKILEQEGFNVEIARDGPEGLDRIKTNGYNVIISDFQMPQMRGDEFYLEVKRLDQGLEKKIIFVSAIINDPSECIERLKKLSPNCAENTTAYSLYLKAREFL